MKFSQKRNCNRCRALVKDDYAVSCSLFYNNKLIYDINTFTSYGKPLEPCPKPITYNDYLNAFKEL